MTATPSNLPLGSTESAEHQGPELVIQPLRGWIPIDWKELTRYRELLFFFIWRDIKVRYKQAILGSAWAVLQPVINTVLFVAIFNGVFKLGGVLPPDVPYSVYVFTALLPWMFFSNSVSIGGQVLINQQHMLTKIYFPRIFLPTAAVGANWVDQVISFAVLLGFMLIFKGMIPSLGIVTLPLLWLLTVMMSLGFVYLLSALTVIYRDFKFITPFMLQLMSYASFIQYPAKWLLKDHPNFGYILAINPMFGLVEAYRYAIIGRGLDFNWGHLAISMTVIVIVFVTGLFYFRRTERRFADVA
jgi:lipopolysaccharide transport system permease protein